MPKFIEKILFYVFIKTGSMFFPCVSIYAPEPEEDVLVVHFALNPQVMAVSARLLDEESLK